MGNPLASIAIRGAVWKTCSSCIHQVELVLRIRILHQTFTPQVIKEQPKIHTSFWPNGSKGFLRLHNCRKLCRTLWASTSSNHIRKEQGNRKPSHKSKGIIGSSFT